MGILLEKLYYDLEARTENLSKGFSSAEKRLERFAGLVKEHPTAALGALSATMILVSAEAAKMGAEFDESMRKATSSLPVTTAQFADLKREIVDLSKTGVQSIEELTAGLGTLSNVGGLEFRADPAAAIQRLQLVSEAARASGSDLQGIIHSLDDVMDGFQLSGNKAADMIVRQTFAMAQGRAAYGDFLQTLAEVAPTAHAAGVPIQEAAAAVAALYERGVQGERIVRGLRQALGGMVEGGDKVRDSLAQVGIKLEVVNGHLRVIRGPAQEFGQALDDARTHVDAMGEALDRQMEGPGARWRTFMQLLKADAVSIGDLVASGYMKLGDVIVALGRAAQDAVTAHEAGQDGAGRPGAYISQDPFSPFGRRSPPARRTGAPYATGDVNFDQYTRPASTGPDPKKLEEQRQAVQGLQSAIDSLTSNTLSALERQYTSIDVAMRKAFDGHVPAEYQQRLAELQQHLNFAAGAEQTDTTLRELSAEVDHILEKSQATGALGDEWDRIYLYTKNTITQLRTSLADMLSKGQQNTDEYRQLTGQLAAQEALTRRMAGVEAQRAASVKQSVDGGAKQAQQLNSTGSKLRDQAASIERAARGGIQLAQAFGLVDQNTAAALENIAQIAAGITSIKGGDLAGGVLSIMGGVASLVSAIASSGHENPGEAALREALERDAAAVQQHAKIVGEADLAITGKEFSGASSAIGDALSNSHMTLNDLANIRNTIPTGWSRDDVTKHLTEFWDTLRYRLAAVGMSMSDLADMAEKLGITFQSQLNPTVEELAKLTQALQEVQLNQFAETFSGQMDLLQRKLDLFHVTDAVQQLVMLQQAIVGLHTGSALDAISQFDLTTSEGRAAAQAWLQQLFTQATSTTLTSDQIGALFGNLDPQEFFDAISKLGDAIGQAGQQAGDQPSNIGIDRSITVAQGTRLAALLTTSVYWNQQTAETAERIEALLSSLVAQASVQPPTWDELQQYVGAGSVAMGDVIVQVSIDIGGLSAGGATPQDIGQQAGAAAGAALVKTINRALGIGGRLRATVATGSALS